MDAFQRQAVTGQNQYVFSGLVADKHKLFFAQCLSLLSFCKPVLLAISP